MKFSIILCLVLIGVFKTECAKVLGIFHTPGTSHYLSGSTMMKILAAKGHEVTIVSPFEDKNPPKNFNQVVLGGLVEKKEKSGANMFNIPSIPFIAPFIFHFITTAFVEDTLSHPEFQKFMSSGQKFDVVIVETFQSEALKYVATHFNAPLIVYSALDANDWVNAYQGNPDSPAYLPSMYLSHSTHMNFFARAENTFFYVLSQIVRNFMILPLQNKLLHKYYPDAPHLNEISYNASLVFLNADPSTHEPLPKVPSFIDIGGFHIKKPKALPADLQKVLDDAKNGVVYFSLGSNLKSKDMPLATREFLMKTFAELKETVLWKFEDENLPGKPDNVVIRKWMPQNDILAHKNVKVFITHGGIFSTMEAVYHGVPTLSLPVLSEQIGNARKAAQNGYAEFAPFKELTEEIFRTKLNQLLKDPKYRENAQRRSLIMKDKPISQADKLNYWVEYVVRYGGARHLRVSALNLSWYEYLLIDVILFFIVCTLAFMYTIRYLFRLIFKKKVVKKAKTN